MPLIRQSVLHETGRLAPSNEEATTARQSLLVATKETSMDPNDLNRLEDHRVVPHDDWIRARRELLAKEKELTQLRDAVTRLRRELPWEAVTKEYVFDGPAGRQSLPELFDG